MYSRWLNVAVVVLWLSSMSWLMVKKVLPPLLVGQPPNYGTILEAQHRQPPVGWKIGFKGRRLGYALSTTERLAERLTEIRSQVHIDELPLGELTPGRFRVLLRMVDWSDIKLGVDTRSTLVIDPLGRLSHFESAVRLSPLDELFKLKGAVEDGRLRLTASSEGFSYTTELPLPRDSLLGDALAPQTQLPGLRLGQTWTVPAYNPLRPRQPLEILQATVEDTAVITWNGQMASTWRVAYYRDAGSGLGGDETPCGRLWVRRDGTVLKQEVLVLGSVMTFVRLSDAEAVELKKTAESLSIDYQRRGPFEPPDSSTNH